jgi:phenylacetate-CoA ligase
VKKWMESVYAASPVWAQQIGVNVFGWYWARRRFGPDFQQACHDYRERESWTPERLQEYSELMLRSQVRRAYNEVPYYREAFRAHGLGDADIENFRMEDLPKLPMLEKQRLRKCSESLLTQSARRRPPAYFCSSGTTGTPIRVYIAPSVHQQNIAVREVRSFGWAGTSYSESRSMLAMRPIVPKAHSKPPFWRYNLWEHQVYLSLFHLGPASVDDYVGALNRFRPVTMTGFPSGIYALAKLIREHGLQVHSPRAIVTTSERLQPSMRIVIESVFQSRAYEEYGSLENCSLATECEHGRLHVSTDFGHIEILRADGRPAAPGELGEVVVTGFANTDQIFIRYRLNDLAAWDSMPCDCGRNSLPVLADLVGRIEDTVVLRDGRRTPRFDFLFKDLPTVAEAQVVQESLDRITINVVPAPGFSVRDKEAIRTRMATRVDPDILVDFREVATIPREPNGKFRPVVSRVSLDSADSPQTAAQR